MDHYGHVGFDWPSDIKVEIRDLSELIATSHNILIVGLGLTGVSVARYLSANNRSFWLADTNPKAEYLEAFKNNYPEARVLIGELDASEWDSITQIVISPGVPRSHPAIVAAIDSGIPVVGDVELFLGEVKAPIVAITGSNGKTTVTTIVGEMAAQSGLKVRVGGNIGIPCLDLLGEDVELYVIELSSFQLESVSDLNADVAVVLNLSPDHMDRYHNFQEYHFAKQRIYFGAKKIVSNRDDLLTQPVMSKTTSLTQFGLAEPDLRDFGLRDVDGEPYICHGLKSILPVAMLKLKGTHNQLNALASLAIGHAVGLSQDAMVATLTNFSGLDHRCQWIAKLNHVEYYNDSKATNIGATLAALRGLNEGIILIAGGDGKGTDFSNFGESLPANVKAVIVIGVDGPQISDSCQGYVPTSSADGMDGAVKKAAELACAGDIVLLSPACASFDMFQNYQDRGAQFIKAVEALCQQ